MRVLEVNGERPGLAGARYPNYVPPGHFCPDVNWKGSCGSAAEGPWTSAFNGPVIASLAARSRQHSKEKKKMGGKEKEKVHPGWVGNLVVRLIGGTWLRPLPHMPNTLMRYQGE